MLVVVAVVAVAELEVEASEIRSRRIVSLSVAIVEIVELPRGQQEEGCWNGDGDIVNDDARLIR